MASSHPDVCFNICSSLHTFQGEHYGVDWDGPAPDGNLDDATAVEVPNTRNPLQPAQYSSLTNIINPLRNSDEYGIDIYLETLTFIQQVAISI